MEEENLVKEEMELTIRLYDAQMGALLQAVNRMEQENKETEVVLAEVGAVLSWCSRTLDLHASEADTHQVRTYLYFSPCLLMV